jgi:PIN domain nuclease of toxin-antitoxin system
LSLDDAPRGYLLDTHAVIFSLRESKRLSSSAKAAIAEGPNFISVISYWEVAIKSMKGKIDVGDVRVWWAEALKRTVSAPILLLPQHVDALQPLPFHHGDPFDRILIAQARTERLTLISMDPKIARYASDAWRVIG